MNNDARNAAIRSLEQEIADHEASAKRRETAARVMTDQERGQWNGLAEMERQLAARKKAILARIRGHAADKE